MSKNQAEPMNKQLIPEEMYTARQGIIQLIGEQELARKTDEFRPMLRSMCEGGGMTVIEAVDYLLQNAESTNMDPELIKAMCVEILEPRDE